MEHLKQETVSGAQLNMDALYQICPQCFTESKDPKTGEIKLAVDFEKLRLLLGDNIIESDEHYDFTWVGKRAALQEAAKPIRKTLRPCPEESVDWDNTKNLYIEGDNLEVLKLLQSSYMGKVKMIYIDPPYNTGNDFVYQDDFHQTKKDYNLFTGDVTEEGERLVKNTESNGRFHSDWCSMIYSRLSVARSLLTDDGVIFISIGQEEINSLLFVCNEVFGEANKIGLVSRVTKTASNNGTFFAPTIDFVLCYARCIDKVSKFTDKVDETLYKKVETSGVHAGEKYRDDVALYQAALNDLRPNQKYFIECPDGSKVIPPCSQLDEIMREGDGRWRWSKEKYLSNKDLLVFKETKNSPLLDQNGNKAKYNIYTKSYLSERQETGTLPRELWDSFINRKGADYLKKVGIPFDFSKPWELISYMMDICKANKDSIILDFFSGSATTADAVIRSNKADGGNRKFILVQLPEKTEENSQAYKSGYKNICEIGKERIRRIGKIILEDCKKKQGDLFSEYQKPIDVGFRVFKCADSNMKDVYFAPSEYSQDLLLGLESNIKEERNDLDLLFGCMLDWGVTIDLPLRSENVDGVTIYIVNEGDLVACFDQNIPESTIDHIASLLPMRVVLRDSCFKEAKEKMNFFEIFKQRTGWSEEEVKKNVKVI